MNLKELLFLSFAIKAAFQRVTFANSVSILSPLRLTQNTSLRKKRLTEENVFKTG